MLDRFSQLIIRWRYLLALTLIALVAWLASLTGSISFDTNYKIFFKASDPIVTAYDQIEDEFSSSYSLIYIVDVQQGDLFTEQRLRLLEQLSNAVKLQDNVQRVNSLSNFQFTEAQGDDLLVNDLIDSRAGATLDVEKIRRVALDKPQFAQVTGASPALMFAHVGEHNLRSMLSGTFVALLLIFIAIAFAFRSATLSLFCMLPNLLPIIFAFGVWRLALFLRQDFGRDHHGI